MNYKTAIEEFDTLDEDNKAKEIYAHFGLAVFYAQVLEQQAINMIAIYRQAKNKITPQVQVDTLWDDYDLGSRTFGVLVNEIIQLYSIADDDHKELKAVLKLRNYIAHDYFRFNTKLFYSETGQKRMIKDFVDFQNRAKTLDIALKGYVKVYSNKIGLTEEKIERLLEQTIKNSKTNIITDDYKTIIK